MSSTRDEYDLSALEARVALEPGCADYPALAEVLRRRGDLTRAREVAEAGLAAAPHRLAGRVAFGLALLDAGKMSQAREILAQVLDPALAPHRKDPDAEGLADHEIEAALSAARPQVEEMLSANRMAEQVLDEHASVEETTTPIQGSASAHQGSASAQTRASADDRLDEGERPATSSGALFRTETMADLLDRQGDSAGAEAIRRELAAIRNVGDVADYGDREAASVAARSGALEGEPAEKEPSPPVVESAKIETLERWLRNLDRGRS